MKKEIVVGVTGASGAIYARRLLEVLCKDAKVHIIVSDVAAKIAAHEGVSFEGLKAEYHANDKLFASIASGSHKYDGMVVIPCSSKTLAAIANGYADNLITRTADVCLKEAPDLHPGHPRDAALENPSEEHAGCRGGGGNDHAGEPRVLQPAGNDRRSRGHGGCPGARPPRGGTQPRAALEWLRCVNLLKRCGKQGLLLK